MIGNEGLPHQDVVAADGKMVGSIGKLLWHDASGFDVVALDRPGEDVVIPVKQGKPIWEQSAEEFSFSTQYVEFSSQVIQEAPTTADMFAVHDIQEAISLVAAHYKVELSGPPPGPGTSPLPPWWTDEPEPEDEPDKGNGDPPVAGAQ